MQKRISIELYAAAFAALFLLISFTLNLFGKLSYTFTAINSVLFIYVAIIWGYFRQTSSDKKATLLIFLIVLLVLSQFISPDIRSVNDQARLETMRSLVLNNTLETGPDIGIDKFIFAGKYYSNKPPVLSFMGAGVYGIIREVGKLIGKKVGNPFQVYYWITLFLITIPSALAAALFYKILAFTRLEQLYRFLLSFAFIFGTLMFSYSGIINNHSVAAVVLLAGFYFLLCTKFYGSMNSAFASGFFFALAATIDLPSILWLALFGVFLLMNQQIGSYPKLGNCKFLIFYIVGAMLPLIFHLSFDYQMTGDFIPPFLHKGSMGWPDSPWIGGEKEVWYKYIWNLTLGHYGLFTYTPIFFFSIAGLILQLKRRTQEFWLESIFVLAGVFILFLFYGVYVREPSYGGWAYGFRYLVPTITPFLMFFIAPFLEENKSHVVRILFFMVLYYSVVVAYIGTSYYFRIMPPPIYFPFPF